MAWAVRRFGGVDVLTKMRNMARKAIIGGPGLTDEGKRLALPAQADQPGSQLPLALMGQ